MSHGLEYGYPTIAARAPADARATFIRRTYGHLAGAVLAFVALESVLLNLPGIDELVNAVFGGRVSWLLILGAFMVVSWLADRWARSDVSAGLQYLGLGLYVVAESIIFVPLLYIAQNHFPGAIQSAGTLTLGVFA